MTDEVSRRRFAGVIVGGALASAAATEVAAAANSPHTADHPGREPITGPKVEVIDEVVISPEPHTFSAWPVVQKLTNGHLVVSYCEHPQYYEKMHPCPTQLPMISHSTDGGKSWDKYPTAIGDYKYWGNEAFTITALSDGSLLAHVLMMRWPSGGWGSSGHPWGEGSPGVLLQFRSINGGTHWQAPDKVEVGSHKGAFTMRPGVYLGDELLLAYAAEYDLPRGCFLLRSKDQGKSWSPPTAICQKNDWFFTEPTVVVLKSGRLLCVLRTGKHNNRGGPYVNLHQCHSDDGGKTWSDPADVGQYGYPAHLLQISDDRVLCIYGHRLKPYSVRAIISENDGKTWGAAHTVANINWGDMGYPTAVELDDASVFCAYYGYDSRPHWVPIGGACNIWGVRFRV